VLLEHGCHRSDERSSCCRRFSNRHWEREYFWQEVYTPFEWCAECTKCNELTDSDEGKGCRDKDRNKPDCKKHDQLWVQNCNDYHGGKGSAVFNVLQFPEFDMIREKSSRQCLTRVNGRYVRLDDCNENNKDQKWEKIRLDQPFDLRNIDKSDHRCLTQAHHPKSSEVLHMKDCVVAYDHDTALWEAIPE